MKRFEIGSFAELAETLRRPFHRGYYAMYSSVFAGIVTDPVLMVVPVDDHVVHRGDGVFESLKCVGGSLYNLAAHLQRLTHSTVAMGLRMPLSAEQLRAAVVETVRSGGHPDCAVRVLVSRGPGSFGVNPYDCPEPQAYVIATWLDAPFMEKHPGGARVKSSAIPAKPAFFAAVKTCNYLPNVLMKKEAIEAGVDYVAGFDERGRLTEGATENMGIVTPAGALCFPRLDGILAGTTMLRVAELAKQMVSAGELSQIVFADIFREDVARAAEFLIVGTTPNVAAVTEFDGRPVASGKPGPICGRLGRLLAEDMRSNTALLTPVFGPMEHASSCA